MNKGLRFSIMLLVPTTIILGTALFSEQSLTANNSGAPAMRTGSPGDTKSCTYCHTGAAQNLPGIISSNIPPTGYVPGATYMISANVSSPNLTRFGFEISPQNISGAKLGVMTITDLVRTKLVGSGKYITHTASGTSGTGSNSWSFNWTAPTPGSGDVTFYGAFNFSNHNNASSGDAIKLDHLTVQEDLSTFTQEIGAPQQLAIYPNPVSSVASLSLPSMTIEGTIQIFDMSGSLVRSFEVSPNSNLSEIDVTTFKSGTYYVSFATEKRTYTSKLIKL